MQLTSVRAALESSRGLEQINLVNYETRFSLGSVPGGLRVPRLLSGVRADYQADPLLFAGRKFPD